MTGAGPAAVRLAYLTNIPSPYRAAMIRAWAEHNPDLAISVFYTDPDDQGRGWATAPVGAGVVETRLPVLVSVRKYGKFNRRLWRMVRDHDVVMIGGFEQASYLAAAAMARAAGKPVILLFDGFSPARFGREPAPVLALKRLTARLASGFFANGRVSARYLQDQLGVGEDRPIRNQYLSHLEAPVAAARARWSGMSPAEVRARLGVALAGPVLLSCGYLIERKRIDLTIDAIAALPAATRPGLLVVGAGPLESALRERAAARGLSAYFAGFRQPHELADFYFAADAMVLASRDDPWGLVVNEAMSAGVPIVASDACGAVPDLVIEGSTGFVFASESVQGLRVALEKLLASDMAQTGARARDLIGNWTAARSASNLGALVAAVRAGSGGR